MVRIAFQDGYSFKRYIRGDSQKDLLYIFVETPHRVVQSACDYALSAVCKHYSMEIPPSDIHETRVDVFAYTSWMQASGNVLGFRYDGNGFYDTSYNDDEIKSQLERSDFIEILYGGNDG